MPFNAAPPKHPRAAEIAVFDRLTALLSRSWGKGCEGDNCVLHTMLRVVHPPDPLWYRALNALRDALPTGHSSIVGLNDAPETTLADVLTIVARARRAIEMAL